MKLLLADRALQYADVRIRNSLKKCFNCHRAILPQTAAVRYSDSSDIRVRGGSVRPHREIWELPCALAKRACMHAGISTIFGSCWRSVSLAMRRESDFADMICFAGRYDIAPDILMQLLF